MSVFICEIQVLLINIQLIASSKSIILGDASKILGVKIVLIRENSENQVNITLLLQTASYTLMWL